jgi:hypothetical protein
MIYELFLRFKYIEQISYSLSIRPSGAGAWGEGKRRRKA